MSYSLEWADLPEPAASARAQHEACIDSCDICRHTPPCATLYFDLAGFVNISNPGASVASADSQFGSAPNATVLDEPDLQAVLITDCAAAS